MKITITAETGYVGLSLAVLLSQHHEVIALDVIKEKVDLINAGISPIHNDEIQDFLFNMTLNLSATLDKNIAYQHANFVTIATSTNYDAKTHYFNTKSIKPVIVDAIAINAQATVVIKSTVPVGYVDRRKAKFGVDKIFFHLGLYVKGRLCAITFTLLGLLLVNNLNRQRSLHTY